MDATKLLDVALAAAREAVAVHVRHLGQVRIEDWSDKGVSDFVTHVDREAEAGIVARVSSAFPDHQVLAEEAAAAAEPAERLALIRSADWLWIVDPLDGTTNYLHRYPAYAVSIAVARRGELLGGVVIHGGTGEEWTATRGGGAFRNGVPVHVSGVETLRLSLIGTGFPFKNLDRLPRYLRQFDAVLRRSSGIRRAGSAALDLCHVAAGYFDGFWELVLAPWDLAAGTLIVREAGGLVTTLEGGDGVLGGGPIVAGNPAVHRQLRALLADVETAGGATG